LCEIEFQFGADRRLVCPEVLIAAINLRSAWKISSAGFRAEPVANARHRGFCAVAVLVNVLTTKVGNELLEPVLF